MPRKSHKKILEEAIKKREIKKIDDQLLADYLNRDVKSWDDIIDLLDVLSAKENIPEGFVGLTWQLTDESASITLLWSFKQRSVFRKNWHHEARGESTKKRNMLRCIQYYIEQMEAGFPKARVQTEDEVKAWLNQRMLNQKKR